MDVISEVLEPQLFDISNLIEAIDCLNLKLNYIKIDYMLKTEIEKNEIRLEQIRINLSISRILRILKKKIKEFDDSIIIYEYALKECNYE
jgi:hypothetical protein